MWRVGTLSCAREDRHLPDTDGATARRLGILTGADPSWLVLVPLSILAEQLVRAWNWRQLLYPLRPAGRFDLFGTIMAGYLLAGAGQATLMDRRENKLK